jgi:hypothetical protein
MVRTRSDLYRAGDEAIDNDPAYENYPDVSLQPDIEAVKPDPYILDEVPEFLKKFYGQPGGAPDIADLVQGASRMILPTQEAITPGSSVEDRERYRQLYELEEAMAQRAGLQFDKQDYKGRYGAGQRAQDIEAVTGERLTSGLGMGVREALGPQVETMTELAEGKPFYELTPMQMTDAAFAVIDTIDVFGVTELVRRGLTAGVKALAEKIANATTRQEKIDIAVQDSRGLMLLNEELNRIKTKATGEPNDDMLPSSMIDGERVANLTGFKGRPESTSANRQKLMDHFNKISKDKPEGFTKREFIEEAQKVFPELNFNQLNSLYLGRKYVDGKPKETFPFQKFMVKGSAGKDYEPAGSLVERNISQRSEVLDNLALLDNELGKNPPSQMISPGKAAEIQQSVTGSKTRIKNITEYAKAYPNSNIAKYVKDPQKPGGEQLTDDMIKSLQEEYDEFQDFVPLNRASTITGIRPTTFRRLWEKNEKNLKDLVAPKQSKGRERNFISTFISPANPKTASLTDQANHTMFYDAYRSGKFGTKDQFAEFMEERGIIPKKIWSPKDKAYIDNPAYQKNNPQFVQENNFNKQKLFADLVADLDEGIVSYSKLKQKIQKRNDLTKFTKEAFIDFVNKNQEFKEQFVKEYKRTIGNKFGDDAEQMAADFARVFAGHMAHIAPIAKFKGTAKRPSQQFKLSPAMRGLFNNPEFYRINLGFDNIALQPRQENILKKSVKNIGKEVDVKNAVNQIIKINKKMLDDNQSVLLEFKPGELSDEAIEKINKKLTPKLGFPAVYKGEDGKIDLFLGTDRDMSLEELQTMFLKRLNKFKKNPKDFKISQQRPEGSKVEDEDLVFGSAPYIRKNFPLNFKQGGPVKMAIGGDPLENLNQQQFSADPAFEGEDYFSQAVESGNLQAFNPIRLFNIFGKSKGVVTPKDIQPTMLPSPGATDELTPALISPVERNDFPFQSFTLEKMMSPNAPNAAKPQAWADFLMGGQQAPLSEIKDSGLEQFLRDYEKFFPDEKVTRQQLIDYYQESPIGNLNVIVKNENPRSIAEADELTPDQEDFVRYGNAMGLPKHKNAGSQPLDEVGKNYRNVIVQAGSIPGESKAFVESGHFDDPNIIAFTRVADYAGPEGQKIAVIQELQTDMLTSLRKEQERIDAMLKRLDKAEQKLRIEAQSTDPYVSANAINRLEELNKMMSTQQKEILKETKGIKPFPNAAGKGLIPRYSEQLTGLQKLIDDEMKARVAQDMPYVDEKIFDISQQQLKIRDDLLDLNRALELDSLLKDIRVPGGRTSEEIARFGEESGLPSRHDTKELKLFGSVPFQKQKDYVDLILKATIKDAQSKGIEKVGIYPGKLVTQRWGKDIDGPEGKKFKDLYDRVAIQQMKSIAKKYGGTVDLEKIINPNLSNRGLTYYKRSLDGEYEYLKQDQLAQGLEPEEAQLFIDEQLKRNANSLGANQVIYSREIAPGQTMDYYVQPKTITETTDTGGTIDFEDFELVPLGPGDDRNAAQVLIEEYNPQEILIPVLTLPKTEKSAKPFFLYGKKDGGKISNDGLVSITDIYGDY